MPELSADELWLNQQLLTRVTDALDTFEVHTTDGGTLRRAAVSVALVPGEEDGSAAFVLCRRGRVGSHRGQWGLPGGGIEEGEQPQAAALRELAEEVGLVPTRILGQLDEYVTRSGFHISPFVVWCPDGVPTVASPAEIHSVHRVGVEELTQEGSPRWVDIPQSDRPVIQLPLMGGLIHAPTAAVLYQFAEVCLRGRHTRVDQVEEPVFAWR